MPAPKKKSRLSPALAAALSSGAKVDLENVETGDTEVVAPPEGEGDATQLKDEGGGEGEGEGEGGGEGGGEGEGEGDGGGDDTDTQLSTLNSSVAELTTANTQLTSDLASQKAITDHVQKSLNTATRDLAEAQVNLEAANKSLEGNKGTIKSLRDIVTMATERLGISLNKTVTGLSEMTDDGLVAQFNALDTEFKTKFKVGQQHSVESDVVPQDKQKVGAFAQAAARATQTPKKR